MGKKLKISKSKTALLLPSPVAIITATQATGETNAMVVTLVGAICVEPPMIAVGIGRTQFTREIIDDVKEFVVNIPSVDHIDAVEICGRVSGRDVPNKLEKTDLTLVDSDRMTGKMILECRINIECRVQKSIDLGSNIFYIAEVLGVHIDDQILDNRGLIDLGKMDPIIFNLTNAYWRIGEPLAEYGYLDLTEHLQNMVREVRKS